MLYNIAMIQYYSRCVIRQLLLLWSTYPNVLLRLGFYMCSLQELCANWLLRPTPDRSASGAREHITRESHDNRLRHILLGPWGTRGILMYKVFPRNLYSTECHTCTPKTAVRIMSPLLNYNTHLKCCVHILYVVHVDYEASYVQLYTNNHTCTVWEISGRLLTTQIHEWWIRHVHYVTTEYVHIIIWWKSGNKMTVVEVKVIGTSCG